MENIDEATVTKSGARDPLPEAVVWYGMVWHGMV